ncbi:hypothetical protein YC2023_098729 [Brassica napus]
MWSHSKSSASKNEIFKPLDGGGGLGGAGDGGSNGGNVIPNLKPGKKFESEHLSNGLKRVNGNLVNKSIRLSPESHGGPVAIRRRGDGPAAVPRWSGGVPTAVPRWSGGGPAAVPWWSGGGAWPTRALGGKTSRGSSGFVKVRLRRGRCLRLLLDERNTMVAFHARDSQWLGRYVAFTEQTKKKLKAWQFPAILSCGERW